MRAMENACAFTTALQAAFFARTHAFLLPDAACPCLALKRIKTSPIPWSPQVPTHPSAAPHLLGCLTLPRMAHVALFCFLGFHGAK